MVQNLAQLLAARNAAKAKAQPAASSNSARNQPAASSSSARHQPAVAPAAPSTAPAQASSAPAAATPNSRLHQIYGRQKASPKPKTKASPKPKAEPKAEPKADPAPRKRPASLKRPSSKKLKTPENVDGDGNKDTLDPDNALDGSDSDEVSVYLGKTRFLGYILFGKVFFSNLPTLTPMVSLCHPSLRGSFPLPESLQDLENLAQRFA